MAEDIAPAYIDLDANSANEIRNLPPGSPTVYTAAHAVFADEDGRLYIRGDYRWFPEPHQPRVVQIRRLFDTRLAIETLPDRVSVQDPKHCFVHWYGEYLFQIIRTEQSVDQ